MSKQTLNQSKSACPKYLKRKTTKYIHTGKLTHKLE